MADELGVDHARPAPRLEHALLVVLVHAEDALHETLLHERFFLGGPRHLAPPSFPAPAHYHGVRTLVLLPGRRALGDLAPRRTGARPGVDLPSPPPCGWSTGFMTVPRTVGLMPRCLLRPALPHLTFWCDWLPTTPTVARHSALTLRRSPLGSLSVTSSPSRAVSWALVPALRASCAPRPGSSSTACTTVPTGMRLRGSVLPTSTSASGPLSTMEPTVRLRGARM